MAKKWRGSPQKKKPAKPAKVVWRPPFALTVEERTSRLLDEAGDEHPEEKLRERAERAPRDAAVHFALGTVLAEDNNLPEAAMALRRADELAPGRAGIVGMLGIAYARQGMFLHAARVLRQYVTLPGAVDEPAITDVFPLADSLAADVASRLGISVDQAAEAFYWSQEGHLLLVTHHPTEAVATCERALAIAPNLVPAHNNRASALESLGRLDEAIAGIQRVADEVEPDNIHALATLVRYLLYQDNADAARQYADRLLAIQPEGFEEAAKKASALAWFDEDQAVYDALSGEDDIDAYGRRLLATAAARLGKKSEAVRLWQQVHREGRGTFTAWAAGLAREGDGARIPYHLGGEVIDPAVAEKLLKLRVDEEAGKPGAGPEADALVERYPQMALAGGLMLRDPATESTAVKLLGMVRGPAAIRRLREFVSGQVGSEDARHEAGQALVQLGVLRPSDTVSFWRNGEWRPVSFRMFEIHDELPPMPAKARSAVRRPQQLLDEDRYQEALPLLEDLVRRFPEIPSFHNHLGACYSALGRQDEAIAARQRALEIDPMDVRARAALGHNALDEGDAEAARQWVEPLKDVTSFTRNAFASLLFLQGRLALHDQDLDSARTVLASLKELAPQYAGTEFMEERIELVAGLMQAKSGFESIQKRYEKRWRRDFESRRAKVASPHPTLAEVLQPYTKDLLVEIARSTGIGGISALKKDAYREALTKRLCTAWSVRSLVDHLPEDERTALSWVLERGGSVAMAEFAARYPDTDPEAGPRYYRPESILDRLRVKALLVDALPGGAPTVAVPSDLREMVSARLAGGLEYDPSEFDLER